MLPPSKKNITSVGIVKSVDILDASDEADEASEDDREEEVDEEEVDDEDDDDIEYDDDGHEANDDVLLERLQFKQLSVGEGFSCGIAFREERENATHPVQEGDLVCWGGKRKHGNMPHHIVGPFKQVSVGNLGVCAIYQAIHQDNNYGEVDGSSEGRMQCWGFVTHLVSAKGTAWDQVSVGTLSVCAVSMISELQCWGTGLHDVTRRPMDIEIA